MHRSRLLLLSLLPLVAGCDNAFLQHYRGVRYEPVSWARREYQQPKDLEFMGESRFLSANGETDTEAIEAAKEIGAHIVFLTTTYKGATESHGAMPITTPTTSTTHYSGSGFGSVYGPGGYAGSFTSNSFGTATTYGSQTSYIPYSVVSHWTEYRALFYRHRRFP